MHVLGSRNWVGFVAFVRWYLTGPQASRQTPVQIHSQNDIFFYRTKLFIFMARMTLFLGWKMQMSTCHSFKYEDTRCHSFFIHFVFSRYIICTKYLDTAYIYVHNKNYESIKAKTPYNLEQMKQYFQYVEFRYQKIM